VIRSQRALGAERRGQHVERPGHRVVLLLGDPVVDPRALAAAVDDAGGAQDAEVARGSRLVEVERRFQVANAQLAVREQRDDAEPRLVTERASASPNTNSPMSSATLSAKFVQLIRSGEI